jgi:hypothetical protein
MITTWLVPDGPNRVKVTIGVRNGGDGFGAGIGRSAATPANPAPARAPAEPAPAGPAPACRDWFVPARSDATAIAPTTANNATAATAVAAG